MSVHLFGQWYIVKDTGAPASLPPRSREGYVAARLGMVEADEAWRRAVVEHAGADTAMRIAHAMLTDRALR